MRPSDGEVSTENPKWVWSAELDDWEPRYDDRPDFAVFAAWLFFGLIVGAFLGMALENQFDVWPTTINETQPATVIVDCNIPGPDGADNLACAADPFAPRSDGTP